MSKQNRIAQGCPDTISDLFLFFLEAIRENPNIARVAGVYGLRPSGLETHAKCQHRILGGGHTENGCCCKFTSWRKYVFYAERFSPPARKFLHSACSTTRISTLQIAKSEKQRANWHIVFRKSSYVGPLNSLWLKVGQISIRDKL